MTAETALFGVLDGEDGVIVEAALGKQAIRLATDVGQGDSWNASPLGCGIAAWREPGVDRASTGMTR